MELNNLSDGKKDGILILYMQGGKVKPVGMSKEQIQMLDFIIPTAFKKPIKVYKETNVNIINGIIRWLANPRTYT